jgi:O-antigen/teichoic acid export membrane protein
MNSSTELVSGRLLARNTIWNLVGQTAPLLVAFITIPILIKQIGVDRFGVLSVAWMLIGYFSLFDFGIDQGLTKIVADRLGSGEHNEIPTLVWTSLAILLALGLLSGAALAGVVAVDRRKNSQDSSRLAAGKVSTPSIFWQ